MTIIHRYVLRMLIRNFFLSLSMLVVLFVLFDFFDRIDNVLAEDASFLTILQYFLYKIPLMVSLLSPLSMMVSVLLTFGALSKNSEIIAMRASGLSIQWIALPVYMIGICVSILTLFLNETIVPLTQRRVREIYNIDIRQKDKSGTYSQNDFWWRSKDSFYSAEAFDSRTNTLHGLSVLTLGDDFSVGKRINATKASWVDPYSGALGWSMEGVNEYEWNKDKTIQQQSRHKRLPLPIGEKPTDFYEVKPDPYTMSYRELRKFIKRQLDTGITMSSYYADLYGKIAYPFSALVITLVVLPFTLKSARSSSMAPGVLAALVIGFSYYAIHSFSIAMGRAEIIPALLSAWLGNILMGFVAGVLMLGAEAP